MHAPQSPAPAEAHPRRLLAYTGSGPPEGTAGYRRLLTGDAASKGCAKASMFRLDHLLGLGIISESLLLGKPWRHAAALIWEPEG